MRKFMWTKWFSMFLVAVMLVTSIPELTVNASNSGVTQTEMNTISDDVVLQQNVSDNDIDIMWQSNVSGNDTEEMTEQNVSCNDVLVKEPDNTVSDNEMTEEKEQSYQYVMYGEYGEDILFSIPEKDYVVPVEGVAKSVIYQVETTKMRELLFEATVRGGDKLEIPEKFQGIISEKRERVFKEGRWV